MKNVYKSLHNNSTQKTNLRICAKKNNFFANPNIKKSKLKFLQLKYYLV